MSARTVPLSSLLVAAAVLGSVRSVTTPRRVAMPADLTSSCGVQAPNCTCSESRQRAECLHLGLHFIPPLPSFVTRLDFSGNSLPRLMKRTFSNITHLNLTELILSNNSITAIDDGALKMFGRLQSLNLAVNNVPSAKLRNALKEIGSGLRNLSLDRMKLREDPSDVLKYLNAPDLEVLSMSYNSFRDFNHAHFSKLTNLKCLFLRGFRLENFTAAFNYESDLRELRLGWNVLGEVPRLCHDEIAAYPNLTTLDLDKNLIWYINNDTFSCMKNLANLSLRGNPIKQFNGGFLRGVAGLRQLSVDYLSSFENKPRRFETFSNEHVKIISLVNVGIRFGHDIIETDFLMGCESLQQLYLRRNFFAKATDAFFNGLLGPATNLQVLDLSSTGLDTVPGILSNLTRLERVVLSGNFIMQWPQGHTNPFHNLSRVTHIFLDLNMITNIDKTDFPFKIFNSLRTLNLSENPFSCTCDLRRLLHWMNENNSVIDGGSGTYQCTSPLQYKHYRLTEVHFTDSGCLLPKEEGILVIVIASLFIFLSTVVPLAFRYRWHIQSLIFLARYQTSRSKTEGDYTYDAFLVYSDGDLRRVIREFLPRLERDRQLRLCIRDLDFIVGKPIVEDTTDCMLASRRVVALLSNALATDEWCQFQLQLAQLDMVEGGASPPLLLLLEDISPHNMTPTLFALLKTTAFLRYPSRQDDQDAFWQDVFLALTSPP